MGLVKHAINCRVIAITNCYQIVVGKVFYSIKRNTKILFLSAKYLANSLETRSKLEINFKIKIETTQLFVIYLLNHSFLHLLKYRLQDSQIYKPMLKHFLKKQRDIFYPKRAEI